MIRRYIEPSGDEVRDTVPWLWSCRSQRKKRRRRRKGEEGERERKKEEKSAEHGGRLHQRGGHIPGWELLHATFRLYCDLCARWGWLRATIYGFRDEREREREGGDPTSAAGWPAIVFNEITKDPRVRAGPYQADPTPNPFQTRSAFLPPFRFSRRTRSMDAAYYRQRSFLMFYVCIRVYVWRNFWKTKSISTLSLSSNIFLNIFIDISEPWINAFLLLSFLFCKRNKFYVFYVFKHCTSVS